MAKSGLKHIDVGTELTKTEWESEDSHEVVHGTSFPSSPVERQLFYRDDEHRWYVYDGTEWVWLGGGSGMEVHGNEYHDPGFASEAALFSHEIAATGIHGAGSDYLCGAKSPSIKARDFVKGFASGKLLKGAGIDADPAEISSWEKVADVVAGSNLDYVDLTSLDGNSAGCYYLTLCIYNPLGSSCIYYLYVNGDTTNANYYYQWITAASTVISANRENAPVLLSLSAGQSVFLFITMTKDPQGYFRYNISAFGELATTALTWGAGSGIKSNATITNITSLRIAAGSTGGIGQNSFLLLCKPRTA